MVVLLRYLGGNGASVLDNTIVEKEQLASGVYYNTDFRPTAVIQFTLSGVATEELEDVEARFFEVLKDTVSKPLNMNEMRDSINIEWRQVKFQAETSAQFFTDPIIKDFLFGNRDGSTLRRDLEDPKTYKTLATWTDEQWRHLIKTWFLDAKHITILGKPSAQLAEKLKTEEKTRVETRRKDLGEEGLKRLAETLAEAKAENDKEAPKEFLERFKVPNPASINFINTITARSGAAKKMGILNNSIQKIINEDESNLPLFIHFEHIKSNFALASIVLGSEGVPLHLRPLLVLYMENFFAAPMVRDGRKVEFEEVVRELERDTVGYSLESGRAVGNSETLQLGVQVEVENYATAIRWIKELMFQSVFDIERLQATLARLLAEIPDEKRSGGDMAKSVEEMIVSTPSSISHAGSTLVRGLYFKKVMRLLQTKPETVIAQLKEINAALCQPSNFRILVIADIQKLQNPVSEWKTLTDGLDNSKSLVPLEARYSRLKDVGKNPADIACIVPMSTIDSSFLLATAKGPKTPFDPTMPALMVATSYLNAVEGPLWIAVRGTGLAYGTSLRQQTDSGQVALDIYRSPDAFKAFNASKTVIEDFVSGKTSFDHLALEGAISSIVLSFANGEATMSSAAQISFVRQVIRSQPKDWPKVILEKVRKVTFDEIQEVMRDVLMPIFKPSSSIIVTTCAPIMQEELVSNFETLGYKPEVRTLASFQEDYGLDGDDSGIDEEEEELDGEEDDTSEDGEN